MKTRYLIVTPASGPHGAPFDRLADAVLAAAGHDGYGAEYLRMNDDGEIDPTAPLRLFSSPRHIGNNPYFPEWRHRFYPCSAKPDEEAARDEVAAELWKEGLLHSQFNKPGSGMEIFALEYDDAGRLQVVDGQTVEQLAQDAESDADAVRRYYDPSQ